MFLNPFGLQNRHLIEVSWNFSLCELCEQSHSILRYPTELGLKTWNVNSMMPEVYVQVYSVTHLATYHKLVSKIIPNKGPPPPLPYSVIVHFAPKSTAVWCTRESLAMVGYAIDLASTLFFLHDHLFYFTTSTALMADGHNHTISTLKPTIICHSVLFGAH